VLGVVSVHEPVVLRGAADEQQNPRWLAGRV